MLKVSHSVLIGLSGFFWFAAGCFLLPFGINLMMETVQQIYQHEGVHSYLLKPLAMQLGGVELATLIIVSLCLILGYFKGRFVLGKSARQCAERILKFPNPIGIHQIYGKKYYIIVIVMMCLGMSIRHFNLANDVRGAIDIIIGCALINGAFITFKYAYEAKKLKTYL